MGHIPADAAHWDSGDWINWHRRTTGTVTHVESHHDPEAKIAALHAGLLSAARCYFELTGQHLPVYDTLAQLHGTLFFDLPLPQPANSTTHIRVLPPHGPTNVVSVDLTAPFQRLLVVRIKDNFTAEGRIMARTALPEPRDELYELCWQDIPPQP